jgi:hypothetical protein
MTIRGVKAIVAPPVLLLGLWVGVLIVLLVGPIDYPGQPSPAALVAIAVGALTFAAGHVWGVRLSRLRLGGRLGAEPSRRLLERAMTVTAVLGILGILFIALDREVLSGIRNADFAAALRCAPEFIDAIEIRRTPFIYVGYLTFSFGFASIALYLLQAEEVRGWPSYLAQASIVSPVGYGLLYSGRMPFLMMLMLLVSVGLVRVSQGRPPLPRGHYLLAKAVFLVLVFALYVNMMWTSRQNYCARMGPVVLQLRETLAAKAKEQALAREASQAAPPKNIGPTRPPAVESTADESTSKISAEGFANQIRERMDQVSAQANKIEQGPDKRSESAAGAGGKIIIQIMRQEWGVEPRSYVMAAADRGSISPSGMISLMSNYFYMTHGVMTLDRLLQARDRLEPVWGIYEIGVLSPIVRVFFPHSGALKRMNEQLRESRSYGFFPTVWGAAIFDFGIPGAIAYIFLWGALGGWGYALSRRTTFLTPVMALTFVLMSIFLSPLQGPLGIANSALVLFSMLATGLSVDLGGLFDRPSPLLVPSSPGE